ncbi:573ac707-bdbf-4043-aed7-ea8e4da8fe9b [Thermothielavioides terrestris]|uniref:chitinase n=1 Tax=Thermothielavioides terrestris TaxID=2587410 RepID=A0A446BGA6_9PEZI|nr:573ac707-bdbf-4043-aed7-ea8e4da8fe9b [Thermothielavioides terrestris]
MRSSFLSWDILAASSFIQVVHSVQQLHNLSPWLASTPLLSSRDLPTGTCNDQTPCVNGACCSKNTGLCGYSPAECGAGNCSSNCDAKASCGQYGVPGSQNCPLNVCCSHFCGSTSDFCGKGCQAGFGGCGDVNRPSCGGSSANKRTIGYYETWANTRKCDAVSPEDLNLNGFTHVNFAFASFDPSTFQITPMDSNAASLYSRFTGLKAKYSGLQTWVSVGGWAFTDPGPTRKAFSDMAGSSDNRKAFINGVIKFMDTYGFDGVDLDWEYPGADDRGGVKADTANYVTLVKEMRAALGSKYGLTLTLPTSYWYLQHFDVKGLQDSVDWFNFMSSKFLGPYIACHTNLTEIDMGLDLLWRAGVDSKKVVLGLGWYGRSFTLKNPNCNTPNGVCQFSGGANAGKCSDASGILNLQEIQDIIKSNNLKPVHDEKAAVKWITWDSNQWVSYDDQDTFKQKRDFANQRCLGGTMVWAMDQVDQSQDNGLGAAYGVTNEQQSTANQMASDSLASNVACYTSDCGAGCRRGTFEVTQMSGQPGQVSTVERCEKGKYRSLCCSDGSHMGKCTWRGWRGAGLSCMGGCADGETEMARNTNHHDKKVDQTCNGGLQSYCCAGFKPGPSMAQLAQQAKDAAKDAAEGVAEQAALDVAAKAFCRVAVPALLAPLELAEDLIPIIGEIADAAEIAATPALIKLCTTQIEKAGKAEFKVFGKKHTLTWDKPTQKPTTRAPPKTDHTTASTKTASSCSRKKRQVDFRTRTITREIHEEAWNAPVVRQCNGALYPQACLHYASVFQAEDQIDNSRLSCTAKAARPPRPAPGLWNEQHHRDWYQGWLQGPNLGCERDEFPPAVIWQGRDGSRAPAVWIRFLPGAQNLGAGQLFNGVCDDRPPVQTLNRRMVNHDYNACPPWESWTSTLRTQYNVLELQFVNTPSYPGDPWGLRANPCWPSTLIDDPGFALFLEDPWYNNNKAKRAYGRANYPDPPPPAVTQGKVNHPGWNRKRSGAADGADDEVFVDPDELVVVDGNSSRRITEDELREHYGIVRCRDPECRAEQLAAGVQSALTLLPPRTAPPAAPAEATPVLVAAAAADDASRREDNAAQPVPRAPSSLHLPAATPASVLPESGST